MQRIFYLAMSALMGVTLNLHGHAVMANTDEDAMAAFKKGIELFEAEEYVAAADSFRKAMKAKSSWKVYYNVGQSEAAAQRYGLALDAFESYLVSGGDNVPAEKREEVLKEIQRLRLLVGVIDFRAENGAELIIDGFARGKAPFEGVLRVAAGMHHIQVRADDAVIYDKEVNFAGQMTTTIEVAGDPDAGVSDSASLTSENVAGSSSMNDKDPPAAGMPVKMKAGIITGGIGVVLTGVGVAFLIKGAVDETAAQKLDRDTDRDELERYNDDILPLNNALTVSGLISGGATLAVGTVLFVLGVREKKEKAVSVIPSPGGVSIRF